MIYLELLQELESQKKSIQNQLRYGIIDSVDAAQELEMIKKKETKLKEELILQYHVTNRGQPRTIQYDKDRELFTTFMPDRSRLSAKTRGALMDKLMDYYGIYLQDMSLQSVFHLALEEKAKTENPDSKTILHYQQDYQRFITEELSGQDIRKLDGVQLQEYTQKLVHSSCITYKAFLKYKGVLNLAFQYALRHDILTTNPVTAIKNQVYKKNCALVANRPEQKIHSPDDIANIKALIRKRMAHQTYHGYFINGYAMLFAIETGVRCGELVALQWEDVKDTYIHIHAQQLKEKGEHGSIYYYAPYTKNEKGVSQDGRKFPLTEPVKTLLEEVKTVQQEKGIRSDYIFCHEDGDWIKTDAYETCLRRLCQSLGMTVTNNHAFRMSLNSNVLIPAGLPVTERARLLGHSVETNLKYYSFAGKDNLQELCDLLNSIA